jgi:endonuclease/exonuclease/phosphatase family metal-dependent hydrolase
MTERTAGRRGVSLSKKPSTAKKAGFRDTPSRPGAFTYHVNGDPRSCCDGVLASPGREVTSWRLLSERYLGIYPSDHYGLAVTLDLAL